MAGTDFSERLVVAGGELLVTTDALGMQAQGAMWLRTDGFEQWRYYLFSSLIDTIGRRKVYQLLLEAFESVEFPINMSIDNVFLGSLSDPLFMTIIHHFKDNQGVISLTNCYFGKERFDAYILRSNTQLPTPAEINYTKNNFAMRVRHLANKNSKGS